MRAEYDFSNAKKNPYVKKEKRQVTINLDCSTIEYFKEKAKVYVNTKTIHTKIKELNQSVSLWMSPNSPCSFEYYVGKEGTGKTTRVAYEYMSHYYNSVNKNEKKEIIYLQVVFI